MTVRSIWLLYHKASLSPNSPMNLDGSIFMQGVGVVPSSSMKEAMVEFENYLAKQKMELMELWKCEQWEPSNFNDNSPDSKMICAAAEKALESGVIHYTLGISSEALDCEGE